MKRFAQRCTLGSLATSAAVGLPCGALPSTLALPIHVQLRCAGTQRRVIRPTEEGVADLMEDDEGAFYTPGPGGRGQAGRESPALSSVVASVKSYHQAVQQDRAARSSGAGKPPSLSEEATPEGEKRDVDRDAEAAGRVYDNSLNQASQDATFTSDARDGIKGTDIDPLLIEKEATSEDKVMEQQSAYYEMPTQKLADFVCAYLRSSENVALVSAQEEHLLFPVLLDRLHEFHLAQLLDILECHWSRSTMLRYGSDFRDAVRDRVAQLATAAATQLEARKRKQLQQEAQAQLAKTSLPSFGERGRWSDDALSNEEATNGEAEDEEEAIFVQDGKRSQPQRDGDAASGSTASPSASADVILAHAEDEITATTIYRALVITGMGAGRRKRDLAFFQLLGNYLTYFINDYRDPHELVRVLTALARAKIVPSPAFLNLIARRLPVLHKRVPLQPVPAYRAMSNFARMGHTSINTYRFLADCMLTHMEASIRAERKQQRQLRKQKAAEAAGKPAVEQSTLDQDEKKKADVDEIASSDVPASPAAATTPSSLYLHSEAEKLRPELAAKERLRRICGLKPSTFTRLLLILARFKAPHQQYLRPLIHPVIVPMIPYFPPPSFTRLMTATRLFHSTDAALIEAYVTHACDVLAPAGQLTLSDVLALLQLLSHEDTPIPSNLERFLRICRDTLKSDTEASKASDSDADAQTQSTDATRAEGERKHGKKGAVTVMLRPLHMCRVIQCIGGFQRRVEIPLEMLSPLAELAEDFARRLSFLMELGVIALPQVDEFVELCTRHQIPDASGAIEQLSADRRKIVHRPRAATSAAAASEDGVSAQGDDDDYYSELDVDVRETFMKILTANDFNTYGSYRPLPGALQVDFRDELTKVTAFELLQSVDLFHTACPGALHAAPRLFLSRSLLEKVGKEGEVVVEEETNRLVVRQPRAELLTREDLQVFVTLVQRTPLEAVRNAPVMWTFIREKAERLGVASIAETATQRLRELRA